MNNYNILHFSTSDIKGGSAKSAKRIHDGLLNLNVNSKMLVGYKDSKDTNIEATTKNKWVNRADTYTNIFLQKIGLQYVFVPSARGILSHKWLENIDVFQLYNVHGGYFNLNLLPILNQKAPIIWRLSDLWPITGHCAYPGECDKWRKGCGKCPDLNSYPSIGIDTTNFLWNRKKHIYKELDLTVVAPSSWTENAAKNSPLLNNKKIVRIPNGIDIKFFRRIDKIEARKKLGINSNKKAILFSAHVAFNNHRKGTEFLKKVLNKFSQKDDYIFIVIGIDSEKWRGEIPLEVFDLPFTTDEEKILLANMSADVVVVPSNVENLPNTILEAFACSKPVVAYNVGGISDVVKDEETGLLSAIDEVEMFYTAIKRILDSNSLKNKLGGNARKLIENEYSIEAEINKYLELYSEILCRKDE